MATTLHMPTYGCEHLDTDSVTRIQEIIDSGNFVDPDFVQYTCISCPFTAGFQPLSTHFADSQHQFAVSPKAIFCGGCKDLVYDPNVSFQTISGSQSSSFSKGKKRKAVVTERSREDEEYIAANTLPKTCGRTGVRGLFNLGETCYMNAVLQMMVHNRMLTNYFCGVGHPPHTCPISKEPEKKNESDDSDDEANGDDKDQKTCVACGMTELFSDAHLTEPLPAHAVNLLHASWKNIPHMAGKQQQDAQEWLTIIVDKLHEAAINPGIIAANNSSDAFNRINRVNQIAAAEGKPDSHCPCFFHSVFYGRYQSKIICDTCHEGKTDAKEEFSSLSLDFRKQNKKKKKEANNAKAAAHDNDKSSKDKGSATSDARSSSNMGGGGRSGPIAPHSGVPNLFECLQAYTAPEHLGPESYNCPKCKTGRAATKTLRIQRNPAILTIHVKRFGMKKVNGNFNGVAEKYEGKLDFPLTLDMGPYTTADSSSIDWSGKDYGRFVYDLDCVIVHQGDHAHTGHYYAYCRVGGKVWGRKSLGSDGHNLPGGRWYRYDDEIVSATTVEDVLRQEAYLLFYGLRDVFCASGSSSSSEKPSSAGTGTTTTTAAATTGTS